MSENQNPSWSTDVLIVGAGPYGLALSARLKALGIDHLMVGEPMGFWRNNMPDGMYLRSSWDWHLDPEETWTIDRFLQEHQMTRQQITPFALQDYLTYTDWFQQQGELTALPLEIVELQQQSTGRFLALTADGQSIETGAVVLAIGFSAFPAVPNVGEAHLPREKIVHTLNFTNFDEVPGKDFLIIGGRQSAFEWAALMSEHGAGNVAIVHRHPSPIFAEADWSWVPPLVNGMVDNPDWYRNLDEDQKREVSHRLWAEGRLKVEPWLEAPIRNGPVTICENREVVAKRMTEHGQIRVTLDDGQLFEVDQIVLATGYVPSIGRVPLIANSRFNAEIASADQLPDLDSTFQTSVPGLYITSMLATKDFGPFFFFTVAARASAMIIASALSERS